MSGHDFSTITSGVERVITKVGVDYKGGPEGIEAGGQGNLFSALLKY